MTDVTERATRVGNEAQVQRKLAGGPAIFLSASVPYERQRPPEMTPKEWAPRARVNQEYLQSAEPARIRAAVVAMTRAMLMRRMRLVFGAHPAISPMVLGVAHDIRAPKGSILIYQSEYFRDELPDSTLELASWESGVLVLTPVVARGKKPEHERRSASLLLMRELMVAVPNLQAAVFVGGMEGVAEEAATFRARHPRAPSYAVASTGSCAQELWRQRSAAFSGTLAQPSILAEHPSYSIVAHSILDDMNRARQHNA